MARGRLGSGRPVLLVGGFVISAVAAALMSSHPLPSTPPDGAPLVGLTSTYGGEPLTALPSAFATGRPVPLTTAADVTRWAPALRGTVARRAPKMDSAPVGRVPARTPEGTTNIVVADRELGPSRRNLGAGRFGRPCERHRGLAAAQRPR